MPEGSQLQVELTEGGIPSAVWVVTPNGRFTIAAYAAPKTAGLWREVAGELADSLRKDSAKVIIRDGPWGREVIGTAAGVVHFIGVDGYRWMIRCVVNGPHETIDALIDEAREALADTVVRRGDTPLPVRTPLPVQLPEPMAAQLQEAAAQQAAQQADTRRTAQRADRAPQRRGIGDAAAAQHEHRRLAETRRRARPGRRRPARRRPRRSDPASPCAAPRAAPSPPSRRPPAAGESDRRPRRTRPAARPAGPARRSSVPRSPPPRPSRRASAATAPRHERVSSSASHGGLDARICVVVAARPSRRSWAAVCRAARAAGADPGAPVQAGRAARTATARSGWASAHAVATAAPIEIPPTTDRTCACGLVQRRQVALDQLLRLRRRRQQDRADAPQGAGKCPAGRSRRRSRFRAITRL